MTCADVERLGDAYLDGELDAAGAEALEAHVATCETCRARQRSRETLSATLRSAPYFRAPASLVARWQPGRQAHRPSGGSARLAWTVAAAAVLVAAVSITVSNYRIGGGTDASVADAVLSGHLRSLMADHLVDVASSDRHTVKPWFAGRLEFSPTVVDLAGAGFPLVGGRLDYLDGHPAAALVYRRREHTINLFVWPSTADAAPPVTRNDPRGYHAVHWTRDHMTSWAVSDLASQELDEFVQRLIAAGGS
jgi:anti-sigma factor RsiW